MTDPTGLIVTQRRYIPHGEAHYGGGVVSGAYVLGLFGDAITELSVRTDGDEGLLASYSDVQFVAPVHGGDVIDVTAELTRVGRRSRSVMVEGHVVCRGRADLSSSTAEVLHPPLTVARAVATVVIPLADRHSE